MYKEPLSIKHAQGVMYGISYCDIRVRESQLDFRT